MPAKRDLDPGPRRCTSSAPRCGGRARPPSMTLADLGAPVPCDASTVSKIEAGLLRPTERFVAACIETFPGSNGWAASTRNRRCGRRCHPPWFEDWLNAEREATSLRIWQPLLVPGLLQTADYARALFLGGPVEYRRRGNRPACRHPARATAHLRPG